MVELIQNPVIALGLVILGVMLAVLVLTIWNAIAIADARKTARESLRIQQAHRDYVKNRNRQNRDNGHDGGERIKKFHRRYPGYGKV